MTFKPNKGANFLGGPKTEISDDQIKHMINELGTVINNQGELLKKFGSKLSEVMFKMSKMDEQLQMQRVAIRIQTDRFNVAMKTIISLGIIDSDIMNICAGLTENKTLPITSDGKINSFVSLSRYNTSEDMPRPEGAT